MIARCLQRFSVALFFATALVVSAKEIATGDTAAVTLRDVDGNDISTADGHITIMTVMTREHEADAHSIAELVPDRCTGDPHYRYVTVVNFQRKIFGPLQPITRTVIRNMLDSEARKLKPQYDAKKVARDPRKDLYVVADFDGSAVSKLGFTPESAQLAVLVFNGHGKVVQRWNEVPPGDSLPRAIKAAEHS